jgi:hypothetical protein
MRSFIICNLRHIILTCMSIVRQRLGIPVEATARNNRTSIARQGISKEVTLKVGSVFSEWSMQSGYREVSNWEESVIRSWESSVEKRLDIENWVELWRWQSNGKKGIRLWKENFMCDLKWQWDCYKSVARIRLVKTENPSACVTVKCKVCRLAIALQLLVVPNGVYKLTVNPIVQSNNPVYSHPYTWHY